MDGLRWAIRTSFVRYVSALPDGRCRVFEGAALVDGHQFWFPRIGRPQLHTAGAIDRFGGTVEFTAHLGLLAVTIQDPWLDWSSDTTVISFLDGDGVRLPMATCLMGSDPVSRALLGWDVRLTDAGATVFGGNYEAGEPLDPFVTSPASHDHGRSRVAGPDRSSTAIRPDKENPVTCNDDVRAAEGART